MKLLDEKISKFSIRLKNDVGVPDNQVSSICTIIYQELAALSKEDINKIESVTPVNLKNRIEELQEFNMMMDRMNSGLNKYPDLLRTQVIVQNYIAFVYLKDNCFEITKKVIPSGTLTRRICEFLLNNPVRAFRNSIAHGNWKYSEDYSSLVYFAYKGESKPDVTTKEMSEFIVSNEELGFWQLLARAAAYTIYTFIIENRNK
jgi:hypothetical protein